MRRYDREVNEYDKMLKIVEECDCCRLGFLDGNTTYIVPLNFGYETVGDNLYFYFHGALDGKKAELMQADPYVSFEMDSGHELISGESACAFGYRYKSVMGHGKIEIITDSDEKKIGLRAIMNHYSNGIQWEFSDKRIINVLIFKLTVNDWSCKVRE